MKVDGKALAVAAGLDPSDEALLVRSARREPDGHAADPGGGRGRLSGRSRARGILKDAEKLEHRLTTLYGVLQRDVVRPIPAPGTPKARWNRPLEVSSEALVALANGPRLPGWPAAEKIDREILYNRVNPSRARLDRPPRRARRLDRGVGAVEQASSTASPSASSSSASRR